MSAVVPKCLSFGGATGGVIHWLCFSLQN